MKRAREEWDDEPSPKARRLLETTVCIGGERNTFNRVGGRSGYLDAIFDGDPEACVAFDMCAHANCVLIDRFEGLNAKGFLDYFAGKSLFIASALPLRHLLLLCDFLMIPHEAFAQTALERLQHKQLTVDEYVTMHFKRLRKHFFDAGLLSLDYLEAKPVVCNPSPIVARWPFVPAAEVRGDLDVDQVCAAIMQEPEIGTPLERLYLVRRLQPETVATLEVPCVLNSKETAHDAMVKLLGKDLLKILPTSAIVAGGSLVSVIGGAPFLEGWDIDVFMPTVEDTDTFVAALEKLGFTEQAKRTSFGYPAQGKETWLRNLVSTERNLRVQAIASNLAIDARCLIAGFDEDYVQIAWMPSQSKVVATLDCWRALLTRKSRVVLCGKITQKRFEKLRKKGFSVTKSIFTNFVRGVESVPADLKQVFSKPTKTVLGDFSRRANYDATVDMMTFGMRPPIWPCVPAKLLFDKTLYTIRNRGDGDRVNGPALVSPLLKFENRRLIFSKDWSQEHNNFEEVIAGIHAQLSVPLVKKTLNLVSLKTDVNQKDNEPFTMWVRCHCTPIYKNATDTVPELYWTILSFVQEARSPFCSFV